MNSEGAKRVLAAYRPGSADTNDPEVVEALELVRRDPALQRWFESHCAFQVSVRESFRQIPVSNELLGQVLARSKTATAASWRRLRAVWAVAAALAILLTLAGLWVLPRSANSFSIFRERMVSAALREYRMDIVTNDMNQIRRFLATNNAPADYFLPEQLEKLAPMGAGLLSWQGQPVSMVCLDSGKKTALFLFVVDSSTMSRPPPSAPEFVPVNKLMTASWREGAKTYLLAGPEGVKELRQYF